MSTRQSVLHTRAREAREALLAHSHRVTFPGGTRIFDEGGPAEESWIIQCGAMAPDGHVPGRRSLRLRRRAAVIADRLDSARTRLLDLSAPHGSGTPLADAR